MVSCIGQYLVYESGRRRHLERLCFQFCFSSKIQNPKKTRACNYTHHTITQTVHMSFESHQSVVVKAFPPRRVRSRHIQLGEIRLFLNDLPLVFASIDIPHIHTETFNNILKIVDDGHIFVRQLKVVDRQIAFHVRCARKTDQPASCNNK